jgi:GAF domain-containing protein
MADSPLADSLATLSRFFVGDGTLADTLTRVSELTVEAIPAAELVGITMPVEGRHRTAVFTDPTAPEVDQAQYDTGEGPCLEAFQDQRVTAIESTLEDGKWPEFRRTAAAHGIHSTLSFPLVVDRKSVGAMNLYARTERAFSDHDADTGMQFAAQAAIVLANAQAYWDAHELSTQLGEALAHRAVIEQAKGILMASRRCSPDDAFQILVTASQRENVKLRAIAQRMVDNTASGRPSAPTPPSPPRPRQRQPQRQP